MRPGTVGMRNGFQSGMVKHASAAIRRGNILVGAIIALCIAAGACDPDVVQGSGGASNGISSGTGINGRRRTACPSVAPPLIDREDDWPILGFKKARISGTRSGVNCMGLFGGGRFIRFSTGVSVAYHLVLPIRVWLTPN